MPYDDARQEPTSHLIHNVIDDVRELFREEVALARAEVREELSACSTAISRGSAGASMRSETTPQLGRSGGAASPPSPRASSARCCSGRGTPPPALERS